MVRRRFDAKTDDLIIWQGQIVMSRSEEPFFAMMFKKLAKLRPANVLEVGFGIGVSAGLIQRHLKPKRHDILEIEETIYKDLRAFAKQNPSVHAVRGNFWSFKPAVKYDFIFFDLFDYSNEDDDEKDPDDHSRWAKRMCSLLAPDGLVCIPSFGGERDTGRAPGMRRVFSYEAEVPSYLVEDGTQSSVGIFDGWKAC